MKKKPGTAEKKRAYLKSLHYYQMYYRIELCGLRTLKETTKRIARKIRELENEKV